jgi:hypothetical protein
MYSQRQLSPHTVAESLRALDITAWASCPFDGSAMPAAADVSEPRDVNHGSAHARGNFGIGSVSIKVAHYEAYSPPSHHGATYQRPNRGTSCEPTISQPVHPVHSTSPRCMQLPMPLCLAMQAMTARSPVPTMGQEASPPMQAKTARTPQF